MNPYTVLGVPEGADEAQIKRAHRALARTLHPDRAGGDAQEMARVNTAYNLLSDPKRRALYDATHKVLKCSRCGGKGFVWRQKGFTRKEAVPCGLCSS